MDDRDLRELINSDPKLLKQKEKVAKYTSRRFAEGGDNTGVVLEKWGLRRRYSWGWDGK